MKNLESWIKKNIRAWKYPNSNKTTVDIKIAFEKDTGCKVTNDDVKDAMVACGYKPCNPTKRDWFFCISDASPAFFKGEKR